MKKTWNKPALVNLSHSNTRGSGKGVEGPAVVENHRSGASHIALTGPTAAGGNCVGLFSPLTVSNPFAGGGTSSVDGGPMSACDFGPS